MWNIHPNHLTTGLLLLLLAKLSPLLLPFHDGHKVLCLDICIGNIILFCCGGNILPRIVKSEEEKSHTSSCQN